MFAYPFALRTEERFDPLRRIAMRYADRDPPVRRRDAKVQVPDTLGNEGDRKVSDDGEAHLNN